MADSTIKSIYLVLEDKMPGDVNFNTGIPVDGFAGASHHNVASPAFPVGQKRQVYIDSLKGNSVLVYLQNGVAPSVPIAAGQVMVIDDVTNNPNYYPTKVTADPDEGLLGGPAVIAISAMTNNYYGWFWCSGVCPVGHGNMTATVTTATDDSIIAGCSFTTGDLTADKAGIIIHAAGKVDAGYALKADGA